MRASSRIMLAVVAFWLLAVMAHAAITASPMLRFSSRAVAQWMDTADSTSACRVFLVGSSPVVFGLRAATLQASTRCAATNVALTSIGDQINAYLQAVLGHVRAGDTVLLTDRRWTDVPAPTRSCADLPGWRCFIASISLTPYLADDVRMQLGLGVRRSRVGDLEQYPALRDRLVPVSVATLDQLQERVQLAVSQAAMIRARGAQPILAAAPLLVSEAAKPALENQFAVLAVMMTKALGEGVWIGPQLETDPVYFVAAGQHASAMGRERWTQRVQTAFLARP